MSYRQQIRPLLNALLFLNYSWVLGDFLCKMYHFTTSLSYTASIFILVVICTERYFAIIYPITCKQILTPKRLRVSAVYLAATLLLRSSYNNRIRTGGGSYNVPITTYIRGSSTNYRELFRCSDEI